VESGGRPWAVHDNTVDRAFFFASRREAADFVDRRLREGAEISGVGLVQINASVHLASLHVSAYTLLEPCTNLALGMNILRGYWGQATRRYGFTRLALHKTFEAYVAGPGVWSARSPKLLAQANEYADEVWRIADGIQLGESSAIRAGEPVAMIAPAHAPARRLARRHGVRVFFQEGQ